MSNCRPPPAPVSTRERPRALLVDGDRDTVDMYAAALRVAGFNTVTAVEPDEALAAARQQRPDVVVCDIRLRRCFDGLELMERLHIDPGLSSVPLIALTGFVRPTYKDLAEQAGCVAWLVKPCEPDRLVAEINVALHVARSRPPRARRVWSGLPPSTRPLV